MGGIYEVGAVTYVPSFIKTGSFIKKFFGGGYLQTHKQHGDLISLLSFIPNKEIMLNMTIWKGFGRNQSWSYRDFLCLA
jgi:hypothetical protein